MENENIDKRNYDVVSISSPHKAKRSNYIQDATSTAKVEKPAGSFVRVFADIWLRHEAGRGRYA